MPGCRAAYVWACRAVGAEDASDIAQECLRRLWERRSELHAMENIGHYTMAVARNMVVDLLRERQRQVTLESIPAVESGSNPAVELSYERKLLKKMLEMLPDNQRTVVQMSLLAEMSNSDIAEATGMSQELVRQNLSRGRKRLKELYKAATK